MGISKTSNNGVKKYYDASFDGIQERRQGEFEKLYESVESVSVKHNLNERQFNIWFECNKKKKYDFIQLFGLAVKLLKLKKFNRIGHDENQLICCELVLLLLNRIKPFDIIDSDNYDLIEVYEIAKKYS
jgi:hypothetical protein